MDCIYTTRWYMVPAISNWITFYLVLFKWFLYITFFFRKHTYIFSLYLYVNKRNDKSILPHQNLQGMKVSFTLFTKLSISICLSPLSSSYSITHVNIRVINGTLVHSKHSYHIRHAYLWTGNTGKTLNSMPDPKISHTLIKVLAVIFSCIPWINSVPGLKSPYYFWPPDKTVF